MRKMTCLAVSLALILSLGVSLSAAEGKWTGWITDSKCGAKGANAGHKECALKCAKSGEKLVFYNNDDQKLYALDNQELAKKHVGHEVTVQGTVDDQGNIKVAKIMAAGK
ncbi:MAG TPA: DUF5818 domain-containing protein [Terriglobia bacterium]|nr:DUF5818 domain-containing protein [Terriglobia bacterium]